MVRRALVVAVGLLQLLQVGCSNDGTSKTATRNGSGHQLISDGAHQGSAHFFFLPPLVPAPAYSGVFDPTLSPTVTVCELAGSACSSTIAQFSMTAGIGSEVVRLDSTGGQYIVNWHTDQCASGPCTLSMTSTYRIRIRVGLAELGFADVAVVASAKEAKNVDTNQSIALVDGRTLPIKFRIEQGAVSVLPSSGGSVSIGPGGGAIATADNAISLVVPPGSLSTPTSISIAPRTGYPAATGILNPVFDLQPDGTKFAVPATLTIREDPRAIPGGESESHLAIETTDGSTWTEARGSVVNLGEHTVTAPIAHFTGGAVGLQAAFLTLTAPATTVTAGGPPVQLVASVYSANGTPLTGTTITWTSSPPGVASIDSNGLLSVLSPGVATITATSGSVTGQLDMTVVPPPSISSFAVAPSIVTVISCAVPSTVVIVKLSVNWPPTLSACTAVLLSFSV